MSFDDDDLVLELPTLRRMAFGDEDLVQDTCERALRNRDKFRRGSNLQAWLITLLRNLRISRAELYSNRYEKQVHPFPEVVQLPNQESHVRAIEIMRAITTLNSPGAPMLMPAALGYTPTQGRDQGLVFRARAALYRFEEGG